MAKKDLKEMTVSELEKQLKLLKIFTLILLISLIILTCISVYVSIRERGFQRVSIMPVTLFPILLMLAGSIKKINSEIMSRKNP